MNNPQEQDNFYSQQGSFISSPSMTGWSQPQPGRPDSQYGSPSVTDWSQPQLNHPYSQGNFFVSSPVPHTPPPPVYEQPLSLPDSPMFEVKTGFFSKKITMPLWVFILLVFLLVGSLERCT